ncbi:MAG: pseudouridine synthase RluB, partial [Actinomycetota bacterium]
YAPADQLGSADARSTFHAEPLPLTGKPSWFSGRFDRVLKVHRLREVMALIGFTRLEPIVKGVDGDPIDQHDIGAKRADINNKELDWVPAIENFGEGLFLGVSESALKKLRDGVELDDGVTSPADVGQLQTGVLRIVIHEGRNRQVRRMCDAVGYPVERLVRVRIGPIVDRTLAPGKWRHLTTSEVVELNQATTN